MNFASTIIGTAERVPLPDVIVRAAINRLCSRTATRLATGNVESDAWFADAMAARAIAGYPGEASERVLRKLHGGETALWVRRWRWFLLATAGLFGYVGGSEWGVSQYRLKAVA